MMLSASFTKTDIENSQISSRLRDALLLSFADNVDMPKTIEVDGQEYVVDDDEISTMWKDDGSTSNVIFIFPGYARWTKWSDADGHDSFSVDFTFTGDRSQDLAALENFNAQITD
ncbi:hypothetical protein RMS29_027565 (plasmid) [Agrobacterium rosae]|uniref:Uncharacterized protein n=1 Tax=Agrobacterium rosae TaxID=1972867 RepID=A0AAW9FI77_9HYPH|nr:MULTISPECIES: hypothetical protein [Agrobacterium]MCF1501568.1 hypothetical protein [Allorhizobium sp. Av2]MDX8321712.1 hypothetical protein [Agrobacterium sp. rho-8.1]MDX8305175.1 hypothetical protein [Agrobacterium rosae]MDX8311459.1 hypothetical protein [Agrobacterium sp. rho-13.3]MDX8316309.1 hypothetical protein [Agrobacterium rosae]